VVNADYHSKNRLYLHLSTMELRTRNSLLSITVSRALGRIRPFKNITNLLFQAIPCATEDVDPLALVGSTIRG
jgi:hypothetical protein